MFLNSKITFGNPGGLLGQLFGETEFFNPILGVKLLTVKPLDCAIGSVGE
jgi:hypothetical protein